MNTENTNSEDVQDLIFAEEDLNSAEAIVDGMTDLVYDAYAVISLVRVKVGDDGEEIIDRKNFSFINTEAGSFENSNETQDFVSIQEFSHYLASSLHPSPDENNVLLLAVFDYRNMDLSDAKPELSEPESVYQWVIEEGTITPDNYSNTVWNGVRTQPGPEFIQGEFENFPEDIDEENFELPDTTVAVPFMNSLIRNASDGNHVITVVLSDVDEEYNVSTLTFHKSGDIVVMDQTRGAMLIIDISSTLEAGEHAGLTLRSYLTRSEEDGFEPSEDMEDTQEVRGWLISPAGIHAFTEDECIDAYCIDAVSGEPMDPEPNVKYCKAWL
jgi:hypothetical protein